MRGVLGDLMAANGDRCVVVDFEAGLEHLSRGTARHVDVLFAVMEPYFRAMEAARRVVSLADELGIERVQVVTNKVRGAEDDEVLREYCERHGLAVVATVPFDPAFLEAERAGRAPFDHDADSPGMKAIRGWSETVR